MRALQGIVGAEVLAVIVLLAMVLAPADVAPPRTTSASEAAANGIAASASGDITRQPQGAPTFASRERIDTLSASAGEIVLHGRLLGIENLPDAKVRLHCRRDGSWRYATVHDGRYAIAGLAPGTWRVCCQGEGFVKLDFDHTIGDAPLQRLDLELRPPFVLPVFLRTKDGARLGEELARLGIRRCLHVIAVDRPIAGDLDPLWPGTVGNVGAGRFLEQGAVAGSEQPDGRLELDRQPPLHAVLLLRHLVLAQQPLAPGQRELTFTIDFAAVKARLANVQVRLVAADGREIKGGLLVMSGSGVLRGVEQPSTGARRFEDVLPGMVRLVSTAQGLEPYSSYTTVEPGATSDLGDIVLAPSHERRGRVVDEQGNGKSAMLVCTAIDQWRAPYAIEEMSNLAADGDGNFVLQLGPRRYVVRARTGDGRIGQVMVDGRLGAEAPIALTAVAPTDVHVTADESLATYAVIVRTASGDPCLAVRLEPRSRERTLELPPGEYSLDVHDGHGRSLRRMPLHVGRERVRVEVP